MSGLRGDRVVSESGALVPAVQTVEEYRTAMHAKFGFVKGPDGKCVCAYCVKDFDALMEHSAELEMENYSLREKLAVARTSLATERPEAETVAIGAGDSNAGSQSHQEDRPPRNIQEYRAALIKFATGFVRGCCEHGSINATALGLALAEYFKRTPPTETNRKT
jgi:hypothetical protein